MAVALCLLVLSGVLAARSVDADVTGSPEPLTSTSWYTQTPTRSADPAGQGTVGTPDRPSGQPTDQAVPVVTQTVLVVGTGTDGGSGAATISAIGSLLAGLAALTTFGHTLVLSRDQRRSSSGSNSAPTVSPEPDPRPDTPT